MVFLVKPRAWEIKQCRSESTSLGRVWFWGKQGGVLKRGGHAPDTPVFPAQLLVSAICELPPYPTFAPESEGLGEDAPAPILDALNCPAPKFMATALSGTNLPATVKPRDSCPASAICGLGISESLPSLSLMGGFTPCKMVIRPALLVSYGCQE